MNYEIVSYSQYGRKYDTTYILAEFTSGSDCIDEFTHLLNRVGIQVKVNHIIREDCHHDPVRWVDFNLHCECPNGADWNIYPGQYLLINRNINFNNYDENGLASKASDYDGPGIVVLSKREAHSDGIKHLAGGVYHKDEQMFKYEMKPLSKEDEEIDMSDCPEYIKEMAQLPGFDITLEYKRWKENQTKPKEIKQTETSLPIITWKIK